MKKLSALFVVGILSVIFIFLRTSSLALSAPAGPLPTPFPSIIIEPDRDSINANTPFVTVTFTKLSDLDEKHYLCYLSSQENCKKNDFKEVNDTNGRNISGASVIIEKLCGDGDKKLKDNCDSGDYFHAGKVYKVGLYNEKKIDGFVTATQFYVNRPYPNEPTVTVENRADRPLITVSFDGRNNREGDENNNYQVVLQARNADYIDRVECVVIPKSGFAVAELQGMGTEGLQNYLVQIKEQINESSGTCVGGFTYWFVPVRVTVTISDTGITDVVGVVGTPIIQGAKIVPPGADNPFAFCNIDDFDKSSNTCKKFRTAIGVISVEPKELLVGFFSLVLSIAAGAAVLLLIYSGYRFMTSAGDKEKIQGARETITSAIIGLLFIIFSLFILQIIGVDILHLPDFEP